MMTTFYDLSMLSIRDAMRSVVYSKFTVFICCKGYHRLLTLHYLHLHY